MKKKFLIGLFMITLFVAFLGPIMDVDFPFHLKTGELIYHNGEIPKDDPFSFPSEGSLTDRKTFYLTQYWLAQVIFYKLYTIAGPPGIILLRALAFSSLVFLLWFTIRKRGLYSSMLIAILATMVLSVYALDRPQYFSFFFALLLILLLEKFRKDTHSSWSLFFVPPLMLLWSNMHAGFVFGLAIIFLYTMCEALKFFADKFKRGFPFGQPLSERTLLMLLLAGLLAILFSYINPNTTGALIEALGSHSSDKWIYTYVREYMSVVDDIMFPYGSKIPNISIWILVGMSYVLIALDAIRKRSMDVTTFTLVFFTSYVSLTTLRYTPFFIATAIPLTKDYRLFKETGFLKRLDKPLILTAAFSLFFLFVIGFKFKDYKEMFQFRNATMYPERAAKFLLDNRIRANFFNSHNRGSYLIWKLYPYYRVFLDSRHLTAESDMDGQAILAALQAPAESSYEGLANALSGLVPKKLGRINISARERPADENDGKALWKELLKKYNVDLIVHEATSDFTGSIFPLTLRLVKDDEWVLIYLDGVVEIFVRNNQKYHDIISKFGKPKELVYDEIILETARLAKAKTTYAAPYSSLALALMMKGKTEDARKMINTAVELDKKDLVANFCNAYLALLQKQQDRNSKQAALNKIDALAVP